MKLLWDDENLEHIARHGGEEFEETLYGPGRIRSRAYRKAHGICR